MKKILLTNDDGISSPNLVELKEILEAFGECFVIVPDTQKSASAHSISIVHDVSVSKHFVDGDFFGYKVNGTPVDCVKLALCEMLDSPPDLIVSGINVGPNTGISVYYSGTVAAAREGTIASIPSVAFSMCSFSYRHYEYAYKVVAQVVEKLLQGKVSREVTLNVNIPPIPEEHIRGIKITKQACSRFIEKYIAKEGQNGANYYELTGEMEVVDDDPLNDEQAVKDGFVSITPLKLDMTDTLTLTLLEKYFRSEGIQ